MASQISMAQEKDNHIRLLERRLNIGILDPFSLVIDALEVQRSSSLTFVSRQLLRYHDTFKDRTREEHTFPRI